MSHSPEVKSSPRAARPQNSLGQRQADGPNYTAWLPPGPAGRSGGRIRCGVGLGAPDHARASSGAGNRAADGEAVARGCAPYLRCFPRSGGAGRRRKSRRPRREGRRLLPGQRGPRLRLASSAAAAATALPGGRAHIPARARGTRDPAPGGRGPQTSAGRAGPPRRLARPPGARVHVPTPRHVPVGRWAPARLLCRRGGAFQPFPVQRRRVTQCGSELRCSRLGPRPTRYQNRRRPFRARQGGPAGDPALRGLRCVPRPVPREPLRLRTPSRAGAWQLGGPRGVCRNSVRSTKGTARPPAAWNSSCTTICFLF